LSTFADTNSLTTNDVHVKVELGFPLLHGGFASSFVELLLLVGWAVAGALTEISFEACVDVPPLLVR
jgi:hypothetical protein